MPRRSTSIVHICGESTDGKVHVVRSLLGKKIFEIFGGRNKLYCLSDIGIYDVLVAQSCNYENVGNALLNDISPLNISMGKKHTLMLSSSGQLYTWGEGTYGELGLGLKQFVADNFALIPNSTTFTSITCGDYHSCAIDDKGNLFAWGQNFDCQLGLYTKDKSKMTPSSVVESVMFVPKYLPFSLKHPVKFVSCGSLFTAVVTQTGEVWTWGAGECGQLGTGKCTRRTLPQQCSLETNIKGKTAKCTSVSCGVAHVLALAESGDIYSWGLNYKGQLGLGTGDTKSREFPTLINEVTDASKIYAGGHSSALIDKYGKLYTWGSGSYGRLMQMETGFPEDHICTPSLVYALESEIVYSFCFSEFESAALVVTRLLQVEPHSFPLRTNGQLTLKGCGFWDSDASIAKFSRVGTNALHAPRSTPTVLDDHGNFCCKPPKLTDPGEYSISLAVNGEDFINDTVKIHVYAEPVLQSFSPNVLDIRTVLDKEVAMTMVGINLDGNGENANILIQFTTIDEIGKSDNNINNTSNITVPAKLLALPQKPEEDYDDKQIDDHDDYDDELNSNASSDKNEETPEVERSLVCQVNLTSLWRKKKEVVVEAAVVPEVSIVNNLKDRSRRSSSAYVSPEFSSSINSNSNSNFDDSSQLAKSIEKDAVAIEPSEEEKLESLYLPYCILQAQVTLNGYDFSRPATSQLLCHRFAVSSVTPCCVPMKVGGRVEIHGTGFFPTMIMQVWAVLRLPEIDFSASAVMGYFLPCEYVSSNILVLMIPPVNSLLGEDVSENDILTLNDHLDIELTFQGGGQSDGSASISLSNDCLSMHYYSSQKILVKPRITRRIGGDRFVITQLLEDQAGGFSFKSENAKVIFRTSASSFNPILLQLEASMERIHSTPTSASASGPLVEGDKGKDDIQNGVQVVQEANDTDDDSQSLGYQIVCECPSLMPPESAAAIVASEEPILPPQSVGKSGSNSPALPPSKTGTPSRETPSRISIQGLPRFVSIGVMLDGNTFPDEEHFTEVILFDKVTPKDTQPQIPKGGFPLGSNGFLNMEGLVQTDTCLVRIRGTNGNHIELPGTVSCNDRNGNGTVTFHLPTSMAGVDSEVRNGKQNFFFLDVSLDGGFSFDNAETAILQVKL